MESNAMTTTSTVSTCRTPRVWADRLQPATHRLADLVVGVPGRTLPAAGRTTAAAEQIAFGAAATGVPAATLPNPMTDVPFRTGGPPV